MKLVVSATWPGCVKDDKRTHLGEVVLLDGTAQQVKAGMQAAMKIWQKRQFTCLKCSQTAVVQPTATYMIKAAGESWD